MKTLTFADGSTLQINDASTTTVILIEANNYASIDSAKAKFTEANLKGATITDGDGNIETLVNIIPVNISANSNYTGEVVVRYNLRAKTELELVREEINALHAEQEVQDEAIDFLAMNS